MDFFLTTSGFLPNLAFNKVQSVVYLQLCVTEQVVQASRNFYFAIRKPHHQAEQSFPSSYHTLNFRLMSIHLVFNQLADERIFFRVLPLVPKEKQHLFSVALKT